jgi:hypothetical protein
MKRKISYGETPNIWLENRGKQAKWRQDEDYPAYFMSPEDINMFLNSSEAGSEDLYLRGSESPYLLNYSTSAVNPDGFGALFPNKKPKNNLTQLSPYQDSESYAQMSQEDRKYVPEAMYQHELGHFYDPRINPSNPDNLIGKAREEYKNIYKDHAMKKYASREAPAVLAEKRFWGWED